MLAGYTAIEASGRKAVERAVLAPVGAKEGERGFDCDLLVVSAGVAPSTSLLLQAGGRTSYDEHRGHFAVTEVPEGMLAAGELTGTEGFEAISAAGAVAGYEAAHALGFGDAASRKAAAKQQADLRKAGEQARIAVPPPVSGDGRGKCFACFCEDVTSKDIKFECRARATTRSSCRSATRPRRWAHVRAGCASSRRSA